MVEGFSRPPSFPSSTLTSGKHSSISFGPLKVGCPYLLAEVETTGPPKASHKLHTI